MQEKEKPNARNPNPNPNTTEAVLTVFNQINKVQNASKAQVFELVRLFKMDSSAFSSAFELAYLKIFKMFHEKANRKMPGKWEQLATSLFTELLVGDDVAGVTLFNFFLNFLAEGIFSSLLGIRITCARMMFHLLKQAPPAVAADTRVNVLRSIYFLIRLKVSTYKQVGIKLASLVFSWQHDLRDKIQAELFKIMAMEENEQIRKMAITNLALSPANLDRVLLRLRDKSVEIRSIVLRKLTGEKYHLEKMSARNRIHLLYDGYGSKEAALQQDSLRYLAKFLDEKTESEGQGFAEFVQLFRPGVLLVYPHLYALFDSLICGIVEELPIQQLCDFTRLLTNELKQMSRGSGTRNVIPELIWLKNMGKVERADAKNIFQECVPSGLELSKVLLDLLKGKDVWSINECLQLFSLQRTADQMGRNRMFDSLKKMVSELEYFEVGCDWSGFEGDDICPPLSEQAIYQRKMMLSYFDLPLCSNSYDLLYEAGTAMKALWPQHYEIELKQIMAEWNNPEENTLLKEKELTQANIAKLQAQGQARLIGSLKTKLAEIQEQLLAEGVKTRSIILILNRLRSGISMDDFMPIIKEDLAKSDQSQGLFLLGLYCLDEAQRVERFMPLYWMHIVAQEREKLHLLVSLKVTSDFLVKFDLSKLTTTHEDPSKCFSHEHYIRKIMELVLDKDNDIRILAVEALCRLLYHNRVGEELISNCFVRLLLLWWETSSEEVSAKTVHTISIFVKQFHERGTAQVRKLAEALCVFFQILLLEQAERRGINKKKISYNLRFQEFVKRSVVIAMTILKYHKESRQVIWKYQESGAQLGPQQLFILFLFRNENLHYCLEKALHICDFYEDAPLETVILMKKEVQVRLEETNFSSRKNLQASLKKLERDLEQRIQIKNQQTFNEELLNGLRKELREYELLINETATKLAQELEADEIFTSSPDLFGGIKVEKEESEEEDVEIGAVIADIEEAVPVSEEQKNPSKKGKNNRLSRISEGNESEDELKRSQDKLRKQQQEKEKKKNHLRKRRPQPMNDEAESSNPLSASEKAEIPLRTRSRHRV